MGSQNEGKLLISIAAVDTLTVAATSARWESPMPRTTPPYRPSSGPKQSAFRGITSVHASAQGVVATAMPEAS